MNTSRRDFLKRATRLAFGGIILKGMPSFSEKTNPILVQRAFYTMGTVVTISAYGTAAKEIHHAITKAQEEFQRIDALMSVYRSDSHVSRINQFAGKKEVHVDRSVINVLVSAKDFFEKTQGAFNVCVEPMMRLWGFRSDSRTLTQMPGDREIYRAQEAAFIGHLVVNERENNASLLSEDASIDLGGIAVGYSVDCAAAILRAEGIENFLINHSGDILAAGAPPDQNGWNISIPDPKNSAEMITNFSIKDRAVSTSGNYESFVTYHDRHFGHIMDPRTGHPSDRKLSFTAICPAAIDADAYSTGFFCNGTIPTGIAYIAVTSDSKIIMSDNITNNN
jgi:thiamine biosynthesis lipoprotein